MKNIRFLVLPVLLIAFFMPAAALAEDLNDIAYESRIHLQAGTIWNYYGNGDCLIFPYYDVRKVGDKRQVTQIYIENFGEYGVAAKLRFRDWARGGEIFSKDIWIPSKAIWNASVQMNEDGSNAIITGSGNVIWRYDSKTFYFTNPLLNGTPFLTKNIRKGLGESTLYGFIEVIGEEKTSPEDKGGKTARLAKSEQDCPNTLRGTLSITRVEDGMTMAYDAIAIGNFSRGQGSLFRRPGSPYPVLSNSEDTLDQLEFQLSKWEVFGPFSVTPSNQGKTSFIVTFPTKQFHYPNGMRENKINNPFEAPLCSQGETLKTSFSNQGVLLPADSEITLPFSVNVIGLYLGSGSPPTGIDNLSLPTFSYDSGDVKLTSDDMAQRILIQDYEYFKEMFTAYRGLPALGLILREYRSPNAQAANSLNTSLTPVDFSAIWEESGLESILFPTFVSGPSFGKVGDVDTYMTGGASSTVGHPIQYEFDWGDGTTSGWLALGVTSAQKTWSAGGVYAVRSMARCAVDTSIVSKWSKDFVVVIESVSPPQFLNGPVTGQPNITYTYTTGGSVSNLGHPVQYFFDWDDNTDSGWLPVGVTSAQKAWPTGGAYNVTVKARCSIDLSVISNPTPDFVVKIELISTPAIPVGPTKGLPGDTFTYMTGSATSNISDPIEYQLNWGDGTLSPWQSSTSFSKQWTTGGTFQVKAQARCALHPSIVSTVSNGLTVNIEKISAPTTPTQTPAGVGIPNLLFTYSTGGSTSNIGDPVQYWIEFSDGTNSGWLPAGTSSTTKTWVNGGIYFVKAKARCVTHPQIVSDYSPELKVEVETVSTPNAPIGPSTVQAGQSNSFTVGGAISSLGHPVQYFIYWDDGTDSGWIGGGTVTHTFAVPGAYSVLVRARCSADTLIISPWSDPLYVTVTAAPSAISATGGTPQNTLRGTAFPNALQATVRDNQGNTIAGVTVTFTAPASGASGTFPTGTNVGTAVTSLGGVASISFTANATAGSYTVTANTTPPLVPSASFSLTNNP